MKAGSPSLGKPPAGAGFGRRTRGLFLWLAAWLAVGALRGADYEYNISMVSGADADIKLTVPGGQMPRSGFLPMRVRITNRNSSERTWRLELSSSPMGGYSDNAGLTAANSFTVPGASTQEYFIFAPLAFAREHEMLEMGANMSGPQIEVGDFNLGLRYAWGFPYEPLAVDPALDKDLGDFLRSFEAANRSHHGRPPLLAENIGLIDPAQWPADWRLWSSFSVVVLAEDTWQRLDTARRQALLDWVALGGRLVKCRGKDASQTWGGGDIVTRSSRLGATYEQDILNKGSERGTNLADRALWELNPREWQRTGRYRWLTFYLLGFGVLIGPVNLFFFAPAGRRHRLFLTVPLISVAASVLLFIVITISDGFGGDGTRRAVVLLQPGQNRAVVFQRQISRAGLLGARDFSLPADAVMTLVSDDLQMMGTGELRREGDAASGDWFASRATREHRLYRLVPTRERVELVSPAGVPPVVQSTVSETLRDFLYQDATGKIWMAAEVAPGQRVTLVERTRDTTLPHSPVVQYAPRLQNGMFHALGGGRGLIATLPSIRWRDERVLYSGRFGEEVSP